MLQSGASLGLPASEDTLKSGQLGVTQLRTQFILIYVLSQTLCELETPISKAMNVSVSVSRHEQRVYKNVHCTQVLDSEQTQGRSLKSCRMCLPQAPSVSTLGTGELTKPLPLGVVMANSCCLFRPWLCFRHRRFRNAPFDRTYGNMARKCLELMEFFCGSLCEQNLTCFRWEKDRWGGRVTSAIAKWSHSWTSCHLPSVIS